MKTQHSTHQEPIPNRWSVLLTQQSGWWIAGALEHSTVTQAKTPLAALLDLSRLLSMQIELDRAVGQEPFALVGIFTFAKQYELAERIRPLSRD